MEVGVLTVVKRVCKRASVLLIVYPNWGKKEMGR